LANNLQYLGSGKDIMKAELQWKIGNIAYVTYQMAPIRPTINLHQPQVPLKSAHGEMASRKNKYIKIWLITCVHFTAVDGDLSFKTLVIMYLAATSVGSKLLACVLATNILISLARGRHRRDRVDHGQHTPDRSLYLDH